MPSKLRRPVDEPLPKRVQPRSREAGDEAEDDSLAYGPLYDVLVRQLRGRLGDVVATSRPRGAYVGEGSKRALLGQASAALGPEGVRELGHSIPAAVGHPFVAALLSTRTPAELFRTWQRLEVLGHSTHRVEVLSLGPREARVRRLSTQGTGTLLEEDLLITGMLSGFLEALGAQNVTATLTSEGAGQRDWALSWERLGPRPPQGTGRPWGAPNHFAQAVLLCLMSQPEPSLVATARRLAVSSRSLQRRLTKSGTTFRELVAVERLLRATGPLLEKRALGAVAHSCGYADAAHFSRDFKRLVGVPPSWFVDALG